jgi:hypothetical protein
MRPHIPSVVATVDALDFDDVGAEVGQNHCGCWTGYDSAQVQNAYTCEWRRQDDEDSISRSKHGARVVI